MGHSTIVYCNVNTYTIYTDEGHGPKRTKLYDDPLPPFYKRVILLNKIKKLHKPT